MTVAEIATYMGADREQLLYTGAKTEGVLTWYTSLAGDSYKALARAFEINYPGLRVEAFRSGGSELVARMSEETKARRPTFDTLETTYDFMMVSRANRLTRPYNSPILAFYPSEAKEKADKGLTFWTIFRESYMGFGYNKNQIAADAVPKGFDGLLHPQLKGKMAITLNESSARMIGAMIKIKGEAFVKKLKAQDIRVYTVSSAALVDLMASGELGASFHIYRNHAMVSAGRGSPVGWTPMELVPTNSGCIALAAQPPHPHAAALFNDFLLGPAARKILEKFQYGHPSNDMPFQRWHPGFGRSVEQFERDSEKWERLAKEISQR
ncbi:MAG TPA: extracellular solute-binding protein [Terriglobales bacterium]|jgi:iron(III) transport system substrate-binding protein|nr:extracellular solute-binding protein [Terriglobales bacterium]